MGPNAYVALIGAYERDNFGDILFLKVTEKLLHPWPAVPLSLLSRDMHSEGAGTIVSLSAWFDCCQEDFLPTAVIVAGGEVLTCPSGPALQCNLTPARSKAFSAVAESDRGRVLRAVAWRTGTLAYVPDLTALVDPRKQAVPVAINSAGGVTGQPGSPTFEAALNAVQLAQYVSVRDAASHKLFNGSSGRSASVELCPDVVSTLPHVCAAEVEAAFVRALPTAPWLKGPYLVVQMTDEYVRMNGVEVTGHAIARTAEALGLSVVVQPAGVAVAHDSVAMLDDVARVVEHASRHGVPVFRQRSRNVWTQAAVIAHAACFVGTSLHGRIVAAGYARPRVALKNVKVAQYASTWDDGTCQPYDVVIEDLLPAVRQAMTGPPEELRLHATKQAQLAAAGVSRLRGRLGLLDYPIDPGAAADRIRFCTESALLRECEILREGLLDFACEGARGKVALKAIEGVEGDLAAIEGTWSWRLIRLLGRVERAILRTGRSLAGRQRVS